MVIEILYFMLGDSWVFSRGTYDMIRYIFQSSHTSGRDYAYVNEVPKLVITHLPARLLYFHDVGGRVLAALISMLL